MQQETKNQQQKRKKNQQKKNDENKNRKYYNLSGQNSLSTSKNAIYLRAD